MATHLALIGPTASGKESVALELAKRRAIEILSLDSMKVYRGMDIATAKPTRSAQERVPHHLIDLVGPSASFSTRQWLVAAERALDEIRARGHEPLFSGGTALYLKSLLFGLFEGPSADPVLRRRLREIPGPDLHRRLTEVDPITAAKVHENDLRRLVRALEIHELSGRPPSELRREWEQERPPRKMRLAGIRRSPEDLTSRIDVRIDRMLEAGLLEEVRALLDGPEPPGPVARQALGVKEMADYIEGRIPDFGEAVRILRQRTRLFARRQRTWFKHFDVHWVDADPEMKPEEIAPRVEQVLW